MADDEYEMVSHREVADLKDELSHLRDRSQKKGKIDFESIDTLNASVYELLKVFKEASRDLIVEEGEEKNLHKKLDDAIDTMHTIIDQNEKIAEAIVSLADMIKPGKKPAEQRPPAEPRQGFTGAPPSKRQPMGPPPAGPTFGQQSQVGPPPAGPPKSGQGTPPPIGLPGFPPGPPPLGAPGLGTPPPMEPPALGSPPTNPPPLGNMPPPPAPPEGKRFLSRFK